MRIFGGCEDLYLLGNHFWLWNPEKEFSAFFFFFCNGVAPCVGRNRAELLAGQSSSSLFHMVEAWWGIFFHNRSLLLRLLLPPRVSLAGFTKYRSSGDRALDTEKKAIVPAERKIPLSCTETTLHKADRKAAHFVTILLLLLLLLLFSSRRVLLFFQCL